jgi:hypothetical protein
LLSLALEAVVEVTAAAAEVQEDYLLLLDTL